MPGSISIDGASRAVLEPSTTASAPVPARSGRLTTPPGRADACTDRLTRVEHDENPSPKGRGPSGSLTEQPQGDRVHGAVVSSLEAESAFHRQHVDVLSQRLVEANCVDPPPFSADLMGRFSNPELQRRLNDALLIISCAPVARTRDPRPHMGCPRTTRPRAQPQVVPSGALDPPSRSDPGVIATVRSAPCAARRAPCDR